jgi:serine/threonine protein kinase
MAPAHTPSPDDVATVHTERSIYRPTSLLLRTSTDIWWTAADPSGAAITLRLIRPANRRYEEVHMAFTRAMRAPRLPNVLSPVDGCQQEHRFFVAYEGISGTLESAFDRPLADTDVVEIAGQLLGVVGRLHAEGRVHADLTPRTVFIDAQRQVKVPDVVNTVFLGPHATAPMQEPTLAPESIALGYVSRQTDHYQVGQIIHFLSSGERALVFPHRVEAENSVVNQI